MLPKTVLYYGSENPPPEQIELRAGPLSMFFEPESGFLRYIRMGNREILRGIYSAVRDRNWGTIAPKISNLVTEITEGTFRMTFDVACKAGDIDFFWRGSISGNPQGTVTFAMDGVARSTFLRNRIGFCILHPPFRLPQSGAERGTGQPCVVEKADGTVVQGTFPYYISPHQPFMDMRAISHEVLPGLSAEVRFAGDIFEMEDQRNWTDASFKTYCTPLRLPYPAEVKTGTTVAQSVTLSLKGEATVESAKGSSGEITFTLGDVQPVHLPRIGVGVASHGQPLSRAEQERLKALNLSHLRVDVNLSHPNVRDILNRATLEAQALGVSLEVALFLTDVAEEELSTFVKGLGQMKPPVSTWLIFHAAESSTTARWVQIARRYLSTYDPNAKIATGTNAYFTELNRDRPPVEALDGVCYSINPQVHAFDNASLVETLETQARTVDSARPFVGNLPVMVTPITLKPRFNPNATGPEPEPLPGELPSPVDVRQMSLFGAGWTLGSLKYLAESGVYSTTYYETTGWRGVMETDRGSPVPEKFHSLPGCVFPMYQVLADVGEFAGGDVISTTSNTPLVVDGLAICKDGVTRMLLANFTPQRQQVTIYNLNAVVLVRYLDETNAETVMQSPEAFRAQAGERLETSDGCVKLELLPYAFARIDTIKQGHKRFA